ncbi:hypothetical protein EXIGLDRAFT_845691 [Exidia glandulosa HHB12029]|uniref:P-loop containing nucleoside triphosphate hydrolase protein n=1 Tax=Exidia glandulosa HHB12029 TaxID=1314781 RepID=A0A165BBV5_EXIGL|nr:hypothetical protein EXIGLDRAFT_845691 [Exidia glandulosa HHB12029]
MTTAAPFIYLVGYPGVGKQTVAHILAKSIPDSRVISNHLIIDLARSIFRHGSREYEEMRSKLRKAMLESIVESEIVKGTTFIFTGAHGTTNPISKVIAGEFPPAAEKRGSKFIPVILTCDREEQMQRLVSPGRLNPGENKTPKLIDQAGLARILDSGPCFRFNTEDELLLDTTGKTAEEVAQIILDYVNQKK